MKNNLFKKSMSVFLSVLMLLTCWVWVAPTQAEAADSNSPTAVINTSKISGLSEASFNNALKYTTTHGRFHGDTDGSSNYVTTANFNNQYKNILYSPHYAANDTALNSGWAANFTGISNIDSVRLWYPTTTMMYDGVTNPKMGVLFAVDAASSKQVGVSNVYMSANANGLVMPEAYWHAKTTASKSPYYKAFAHLYLMYNVGASWISTSSGNDKTSTTSKGAWEVNASTIEYQGGSFGSGNTYYKAITPTWTVRSGSNYSVTAANTIYVIDVVPLKNALSGAKTLYNNIKSDPGRYTPSSVASFVTMANNLISAANVGNYINSSSNNVTGWNSTVSSAISAYNSFKLEERTFEVTYENLFLLSDWAYSDSVVPSNSSLGAVKPDLSKGTITINTTGTEVYSNYGSAASHYSIPVKGNTEYTFEANMKLDAGTQGQMFVFFYDANGNGISGSIYNGATQTAPHIGIYPTSNGVHNITFTTPSNCTRMSVRFGATTSGTTATYSDIRFYETSRQEIVDAVKASGINRKVYNHGATMNPSDLATLAKSGYVFDGWFNDTACTSAVTSQSITSSRAVYAKMHAIDVNYENLFSLADWYNATNGATSNRGGAITADLDAGTLSIECPADADKDNNYVPWNYDITIEKNTDYIFEYDADIEAGGMQAHLFLNQGKDATSWLTFPSNAYIYTPTTHGKIEFNSGDCDNINIRFGTVNANDITNKFSNIRLYKASRATASDFDTWHTVYRINTPSKGSDLYTPTRTGYVFGGWYYDEACTNAVGANDTFTKSTTVYAKWTVDSYTITWKNVDGNGKTETTTLKYGDTPVYNGTPTKAFDENYHYTFSGWSPSISAVTGEATYTAQFTETAHNIEHVNYSTAAHKSYCTDCDYYELVGHTKVKRVTTVVTQPTCNQSGSQDYVYDCSVCGVQNLPGGTEEIPATGTHTAGTPVVENKKDATCAVAGSYQNATYCTSCGTEISRETVTIPATGNHTSGAVVVENKKDATCAVAGSYDNVTYCTVCGIETSRETITVPATGEHVYGAWTPVDATTHKRVCTADATCTAYETAAHGNWSAWTPDGDKNMTSTCGDCGYIKTEGCDFEQTEDVDSTCYSQGYTSFKCSHCDNGYTVTKDFAAHTAGDAVVENKVDSTCYAEGSYDSVVYCSVCKDAGRTTIISKETITIAKKDHTPAEAVKEKVNAPTCTADGSYESVVYCSVEECKHEISRTPVVDPKTGHTEVIDDAVAATCTATGLTEGKHCSVCNEVIVAQTEVPMAAHTPGEVKVENTVAPSCTVDGSHEEATYCTVCNAETSRKTVIDTAKGHTEEIDKAVAATCTATGLTEGKHCSVCNEVLVAQTEVPMAAHTPGEVKVENTVAPSCTVDGSHEEATYCTVCNAETSRDTVVDTATGHTDGAVVVENKNEATCTVDGSYDNVTYCTVCGTKTSSETITVPATGHTDGAVVKEKEVAPTCITNGSHEEATYCTVCGVETSRKTVVDLATGNHVYDEWAPDGELNHKHVCTADENCTAYETEAHEWNGWVAGADKQMSNTCDVCGYVKTVGCTYTVTADVDSTCYSQGYTSFKCSDCGNGYTVTKDLAAHTAGEAVTEKFNDSTCYAEGSYDEVVYCSVCAALNIVEELTRETKTIEKKAHTAGEAVTEKFNDSTCYAEGSYDEVVYCSVCEAAGKTEELSRETKTITKKAHKAGEAVTENFNDSTCYAEGSYDEVVYCSVCAAANIVEELTRETKIIEKKAHTAGEAVVENKVDSTCYAEGSYDSVVYCSVCAAAGKTEELSRTKKTIEKKEHTPAAAVKEKEVAPTCTDDGSYDLVVYCSVEECKHEISRTPTVDTAKGHTAGEAKIENEVAADCENDGSYDSVIYCSVCGDELNRETITVGKLGHKEETIPEVAATCTETGLTAGVKCSVCDEILVAQEEIPAKGHEEGEAVKENEVAATCVSAYTYDAVVYCTVCGDELSRETITEGTVSGHSEVVDKAIPATCTETGLTEGKHCSVCGEVIVAQTETPATGHNYGSRPTEIIPESCSHGRIEIFKCKNCTETYTETYEVEGESAGPHTVVEVQKIDPTCDKMGYYATYCLECGTNVKVEQIPATGHVDENGDGECDVFGCGGKLASSDAENVCTCSCHKESFFGKLLYKILLFFWKIFGISKSCECGVVHY